MAARRGSRLLDSRLLVAAAALALLCSSWQGLAAGTVRAGGAQGLKAVIISGPVDGLTWDYLDLARKIASQAEEQGMDVRRVFHPHATWARVLDVIANANLVVYLGHGNGWPSPYPPFQEDTKDGFGLNPYDGAGSQEKKYYGANRIRDRVRLADNAVVVLYRACYSAGNGEEWMGPERDRSVAVKRVDNFAAGFLHVGARAVFAYGRTQKVNIPRVLAESDKTMDQIFQIPGTDGRAYYDGFKGWDDYYRASGRTDWARLHLDPHPDKGHFRALTGRLGMTAAEWRGEDPASDTTPPELSGLGVVSGGQTLAASEEAPDFSPNGDGVEDRAIVSRKVSEGAYLDVTVRDEGGGEVRSFTRWADRGSGTTTWDGRDDGGDVVPDGLYDLTFTARDRAGNVGEPRSVDVRVLTALHAYGASRTAIHVSDGDGLAPATRLTVTLARRASVSWRVRDGHDTVVAIRYASDELAPGDLAWRWDGTDQDGVAVKRGWYRAVVAATTAAGTVRYEKRIYVGAYRIALSDQTPRRGQQITVRVTSTEPLERAPRLRISQPGLSTWEVATTRVAPGVFRATLTLKSKGSAGTLKVTVVGTDVGGQRERQSVEVPLG